MPLDTRHVYKRALKALALLGAEIPAVDLKPLREILALNAFILPPAADAMRYATELRTTDRTTERPAPEPEPHQRCIATTLPSQRLEIRIRRMPAGWPAHPPWLCRFGLPRVSIQITPPVVAADAASRARRTADIPGRV